MLKFRKQKKVNGKYPISLLEKAKTRDGRTPQVSRIQLDLLRRVSSMDGIVMVGNKKVAVSWSATGIAFVKGEKYRDYDLVITEKYENVR